MEHLREIWGDVLQSMTCHLFKMGVTFVSFHMLGSFLVSRDFFCGSFMFFMSCVCYAFVRICLYVPSGQALTSWLSFAVSYCEFVTFP